VNISAKGSAVAALFRFEAVELRLLLLLQALLHLLAQVLGQLAVALLADGLAVPSGELAVLERRIARGAEEVVLVIRLVQEALAATRNGLLAIRAIVTKELHVVGLAVGEAVVLKEVRLGEGLVANVAAKVVRMPHFTECRDRATLAWLAASCAFLEEQDFVVRRAIIIAFKFVTVTAFKLDTALFAAEVARVHKLPLDQEVRTNDGPVAHGALMRIGPNHALFGLHALWAIDVLRLGLDLIFLPDEVGAAADANEVLRVEREPALRVHHLAANNVVTHLAALGVQLHKVLLAIKLLVRTDEEAPTREGLRAVLADEMVWMEVAAKSLNDLAHNWRVSRGAIGANGNVFTHNLRLLRRLERIRIVVPAGATGGNHSRGSRNTGILNKARHIITDGALEGV